MNQSPEIPSSKFGIQNSIHASRITHHVWGGLVAFVSFLLYLRTLAPDVVDADGGEFQFAAWNFGFVHPTGYPLYLILGGAFQHLVPIGNPAFRLNLFTAITAAFAVAMVYSVAYEFTRHRGASLIAAVTLGLTRTFWYDAGAAETYALNTFFVALLIYLALRWQTEPTAGKFAAFCFALGLALTHHRSILLWLPTFALFFLVLGFKFQVSRITHHVLLFAFSFLLPLGLYLYIPLRASASPYFSLPLTPTRNLILYDNSLSGFIDYILGRTFQSEIGWDAVSVARLIAFPQFLLDQFGAIGIAIGVIGFVAMMWRREWARFILLVIGFAATILFASIYHIGDIWHYYIPACLVWAIWVGYAIVALSGIVNSRISFAFCVLLSAFLLVLQFVVNLPFADRSSETMAREQWTRLVASAPPNAILISNDRDEMMPLWYMQYVENTRRDVLGLFPLITPAPEHANVVRLIDSLLDTGRPVYFSKEMPELAIKYRLEIAEPFVRVIEPVAKLQPQYPSNAVLSGRLRVLGYDAKHPADTQNIQVAIYWQTRAQIESNYTTFVHVLDSRGDKIAQGNDHQVGGEFYPASFWQIGETLRDEFVIPLPSNLVPGHYKLLVGMYRSSDGEMLSEPVVIGSVEIK